MSSEFVLICDADSLLTELLEHRLGDEVGNLGRHLVAPVAVAVGAGLVGLALYFGARLGGRPEAR